MAPQDIRIHGLFASVINRVGLVGAACWCGSWWVSLGVEFAGVIRRGGFHADGMLIKSALSVLLNRNGEE